MNALDLMRKLESESTSSCKTLPNLPEDESTDTIKSDLLEYKNHRDSMPLKKSPIPAKRRSQSVSTAVSVGSKVIPKQNSHSHFHSRTSSTSSSSNKPRSPSSKPRVTAPPTKRPTSGNAHRKPSRT